MREDLSLVEISLIGLKQPITTRTQCKKNFFYCNYKVKVGRIDYRRCWAIIQPSYCHSSFTCCAPPPHLPREPEFLTICLIYVHSDCLPVSPSFEFSIDEYLCNLFEKGCSLRMNPSTSYYFSVWNCHIGGEVLPGGDLATTRTSFGQILT